MMPKPGDRVVVVLTPTEALAVTIVLGKALHSKAFPYIPEGVRKSTESALRKLDLKIGTIGGDEG